MGGRGSRSSSGGGSGGQQVKAEATSVISGQSVREQYFQEAVPGVGKIDYEEGFNFEKHREEIAFAQFLHNTLGGDIQLITEKQEKRPDYEWRGASWELKNPRSLNAADKALRTGLKQINNNPGGIILDFKNNDIDLQQVKNVIHKRMMRAGQTKTADIMIVKNGKIIDILSY